MDIQKEINKPRNWQDFEVLCDALCRVDWQDDFVVRHGRNGQAQQGVDICGHYKGSPEYSGVQCKCKPNNGAITEAEIDEEIEKAKSFVPPLERLIIATTANKDAKIEKHVRIMDVQNRKEGLFSISLLEWEDIEAMLCRYPKIKRYYENGFGAVSEGPIRSLKEIKKRLAGDAFFSNAKIDDIISNLQNGDYDIRLIGFSGIGKTRIVLEAFGAVHNPNVMYCDCAAYLNSTSTVLDAYEAILDGNYTELVVVFDNCSRELLNQIKNKRQQSGTKCRIVSIFYDWAETDSHTDKVISFGLADSQSVVESIVKKKNLAPEAEKLIIDYSAGLPQMARLMLDRDNPTDITHLPSSEIYDRVLNIDSATEESKERRIVLTSIAIFKSLGFFEEYEADMRYVACNNVITHWSKSDDYKIEAFRRIEKEYERRGIIEQFGCMVTMRPLPIAIQLSGEWYRNLTPSSIKVLMEDLSNYSRGPLLVDGLARRTKYLGDFPEAQDLVSKLTAPGAPFRLMEVVFSELGSRLFQAFCEVNPVSTAESIWSILKNASINDLKGLDRRSRSNVLFAIDHLCFDNRSFHDGMMSLAKLSLFEPESYSNNSRGLFIERYPIMLPSTEVGFEDRLQVLKELMSINNEDYTELVVDSCIKSFQLGHFYRDGGPESQGFKQLVDYRPKTYGELHSYWKKVLSIMISCLEDNHQLLSKSADAIASNVRSLYLGYSADEIIEQAFLYFSQKLDYDWPSMRKNLMYMLHDDKRQLPKERKEKIKEMVDVITPKDFLSRYLNIDRDVSFRQIRPMEKENEVRLAENRKLAKDFVNHDYYGQGTIDAIYKSDKLLTGFFSRALVEELKIDKDKLDKFVSMSMSSIRREDTVSPDKYSLFINVLCWVPDKEPYGEVISELKTESKYEPLLLSLASSGSSSMEEVDFVFCGVENNQIDINNLRWAVRYLNPNASREFHESFFERLICLGDKGSRLSLGFISNLVYEKNNLDDYRKRMIRECYSAIELSDDILHEFEYYHSLKEFLSISDEEELAELIHRKVAQYILSREDVEYTCYEIYGTVLEKYTTIIWPLLRCELDNEKNLGKWSNLLSNNYIIDSNPENPPISTLITDDEWLKWLKETSVDKVVAAAMLLNMVRWWGDEGKLTTLAAFILEKYWARNNDVAYIFDSRFDSYSFVGSGIPIFEERIKVLQEIMSLSNDELREWAKNDMDYWIRNIKDESLSEAHRRALYD